MIGFSLLALVAVALAQNDTTAPAPTTTLAAANETTAAAAGNSTAAPSTTGAPSGSACADDACCKNLESAERPCVACTGNSGCSYYSVFNNNVLSLGGKCLAKATAEPGTGFKKVDESAKCADSCSKRACDECLKMTTCVWCDSGRKAGSVVGLNTTTGSCELESCPIKGTNYTTCSNAMASALSFGAVLAAAVLAF